MPISRPRLERIFSLEELKDIYHAAGYKVVVKLAGLRVNRRGRVFWDDPFDRDQSPEEDDQ